MAKPYIPDRGDIVKLVGAAQKLTPESIGRILQLREAGESLADIANLINQELEHQGREQSGYRPFLVISPLAYNQMASLVIACPITSQVKGLSFEVPLAENMQTAGVVLSDQIKALDWRARKAKFVENAPPELIEEVQARLEALIL